MVRVFHYKIQYFFHDFSMTEALKLRIFFNASWHERDMYQGHKLPPRPRAPAGFAFENHTQRFQSLYRKMWKTPKFDLIPCIEMLDERKQQCCFAKGCLLISMTFKDFPKPGVNFHDFSRPGKKMEFHDFSRFSMTGYTLTLILILIVLL